MGASVSTSYIDNVLDDTFSIMNSATQNCRVNPAQTADIRIIGGGKVVVGEITADQTFILNQMCIQSDKTSNDTTTQIQNQLTNRAKAEVQSLGLPAVSVGTAVTNQTIALSTTIQDAYINNCSANALQSFNATIRGREDVTVKGIDLNQLNQTMQNCALNDENVTKARQQLTTTISQTSQAKEDDTLTALLWPLVLGGIVFILFIFGGIKQIFNPAFLLGIAALVLGLLIVFYFFQIWPYKKIDKYDSDDVKKSKEEHNRRLVIIFGIIFAIVLVIFLVIHEWERKKKEKEDKEKKDKGGDDADKLLKDKAKKGESLQVTHKHTKK